jgi:hypothetical protein
MSVSCDCFVLPGGGLDVRLITVQRTPTKYGAYTYECDTEHRLPEQLWDVAS